MRQIVVGKLKLHPVLLLITAFVILFLQLLQFAALHDIRRGLEPDYASEWLMVEISLMVTILLVIFLILISFLKRPPNE